MDQFENTGLASGVEGFVACDTYDCHVILAGTTTINMMIQGILQELFCTCLIKKCTFNFENATVDRRQLDMETFSDFSELV